MGAEWAQRAVLLSVCVCLRSGTPSLHSQLGIRPPRVNLGLTSHSLSCFPNHQHLPSLSTTRLIQLYVRLATRTATAPPSSSTIHHCIASQHTHNAAAIRVSAMNPPTYTDDTRGTRFSDVWPPASSDGNVSEYDFSSFLPSSSGMPQGSLEAFSDAGLWSTPPSALSPQALASLAASGDAPQLKSSIGPIRRDTGTPSSASPHLVSTQYTSGSSSGSASLLAANAAHGACGKDGEHGDKEPPAPPVKNACTFCRSR